MANVAYFPVSSSENPPDQQNISPPDMRALAVSYAEGGFHVFRLARGSKKTLAGSNGHLDATNDPEHVYKQWTAVGDSPKDWNIGIQCKGLCILDFDTGKKSLDELIKGFVEKYGKLPKETPIVDTPRGGCHAYMRLPEGIRVPNSVGKILPGVDIRGDHGYVVGPGSHTEATPGEKTVTGDYVLRNGLGELPPIAELPEAPAWLIEAAGAEKSSGDSPRNGRGPPPEWADNEPAIAAAIKYLIDNAPELTAGERDDGLIKIANRIMDYGVSPDMAGGLIVEHWNEAKCFPPVPPEDIMEKARNAARSGNDPIGCRPPAPAAKECFDFVVIDDNWRDEQGALATAPPAATAGAFKMSFENQDFISVPPPREWLYGRHYIRKFVSMTVAPGGVGKSSLDLVEAIAMANGRDLLKNGFHRRWKVAVWNGEDPKDELRRRVLAIMHYFEIAPEEIEGRLALASGRETPLCIMRVAPGGSVIASPHVKEVKTFLRASGADVFIVDPFVKSHGVPENDNSAIDAVATQWAEIADECECAIELVHHVRKPAAGSANETTVNDGRGAGALLAAARSARVLNEMTDSQAKRLRIKPEDRRRYFRVDNGKSNMQPPAKSADWYLLKSQALGNTTDKYPEDFVGVVTAWKPPAEVTIFDILARELASTGARDYPHRVNALIATLASDECELFGSVTHRSRTITDKLKAEGIDGKVKTESGTLVFENQGEGKHGGFWVKLTMSTA
jgi:AAA domain/Bifunctional DNA primase/polymerase, N-terminal